MTLIIGNGESRSNVKINDIQGIKIGCNAIQRDFYVDHLICVDRRMVQQALSAKYQGKIYTRKDWAQQFVNVDIVPDLPYEGKERWDEPFQWGSGPYAVLLGAKLSKNIKMIGFDLYSTNEHVNNIYKDTIGYDASTKNAVDPRYWIHQIEMVFKYYPKTKFTIYNNKDWKCPKNWLFENVSLDIIENI